MHFAASPDKIFRFVACAAKLKDEYIIADATPEFTGLRAP